MYYVYVIGLEGSFIEPYRNCYVGVTNNLERRWKGHCRSTYTVGEFIREHYLSMETNMVVIFSGNEQECYDLEIKLRPFVYMGLNEAVGGKGGYTCGYDNKERNLKISEAHKGKVVSSETKSKLSKTLIDSGVRKGKKNGRAKKWELISPSGEKYSVHGDLAQVCEEHKLLSSALTYYRNRCVPDINSNGFGGYRAKSKDSLEKRINTIGWILNEI